VVEERAGLKKLSKLKRKKSSPIAKKSIVNTINKRSTRSGRSEDMFEDTQEIIEETDDDEM
jgi:hypothetical protein